MATSDQNYNINTGYGQAMMNAVSQIVPTFGRILAVCPSSDQVYPRLEKMIKPHNGRVRLHTILAAAEEEAESNSHDVILLCGHSPHTVTTKIAWDKNRIHVIGVDGMSFTGDSGRFHGQGAKINLGGAVAGNTSIIENTGIRNTFRNVKFTSSNTSTSALWAFADGGEFTYMENVHMVRSGVVTTTTAADMLCNGDSSHYKRCAFGYTSQAITANGNRPCVDFGREQITGKVARDTIFEDCIFMRRANDSDNSFMYGANATDIERMCLVKNPTFWQDALATANMDECISFGSAQTNGVVLVTGNVGATGTPAAISTTTGVFMASGSMDGTNPEAKIGIAIQAT